MPPHFARHDHTQSLDAANSTSHRKLGPAVPDFSLVHDSALNYAFQQNAIPVVKELRFPKRYYRPQRISSSACRPSLRSPHLRNSAFQSFEPTVNSISRPRHEALTPESSQPRSTRRWRLLKVEVFAGDTALCSRTASVSLLAHNEWCGLVSLPEILAAFILPNDPALMPVLGRASDLLRETTGRGALSGYQDKNRKRAWDQVAAIYRAVAELGIRYINPPASFESTGQKVSFPAQIIAERFGTCLDLSLLFAACCERAGLNPLLLMHEGHAYAGCWLEARTFPEPAAEGADALQQVRKHETESLLTVFETTLVASEAPGCWPMPSVRHVRHLQTEKPFRLALDVRRARIARIVPLPIAGQRAAETTNGPVTIDVVEGIGSRDFSEPLVPVTPGTDRPATRIDQWKSRLLDLSLRNRLLNFRETKSTIRLLSASPERVEDELAAENELALRPRPKLMSEDDPRHGATLSKQQRADALAAHLADELQNGRLHTHLDEDEHARRLTELYRTARNALEENGTNTLFAAVGILEWRETEHSDRVFRAPLLLVPVELKRKSVLEGFSLRRLDEETRPQRHPHGNAAAALPEDIAGLDPLPEDETGVNVARVFQLFRDAVREPPRLGGEGRHLARPILIHEISPLERSRRSARRPYPQPHRQPPRQRRRHTLRQPARRHHTAPSRRPVPPARRVLSAQRRLVPARSGHGRRGRPRLRARRSARYRKIADDHQHHRPLPGAWENACSSWPRNAPR
jgi:hypothetical protein